DLAPFRRQRLTNSCRIFLPAIEKGPVIIIKLDEIPTAYRLSELKGCIARVEHCAPVCEVISLIEALSYSFFAEGELLIPVASSGPISCFVLIHDDQVDLARVAVPQQSCIGFDVRRATVR